MNEQPVSAEPSAVRAFTALVLGVSAWLPFVVLALLPDRTLGGGGPFNLFAAMVLGWILAAGLVLSGISAFLCHHRGSSALAHRRTWRVASFFAHAFLFGPVGLFVLLFLFSSAPPLAFAALAVALFLVIRFVVRRTRSSLHTTVNPSERRYDY